MTERRVHVLPGSIFQRRSDLLRRQLDDGFVVYDPATENVHVLNDSVRYVWDRCDGVRTAAETVLDVSSAAAIPMEEAATDVYVILRDLVRLGLVDAV